jgi:hypothetical protein
MQGMNIIPEFPRTSLAKTILGQEAVKNNNQPPLEPAVEV